MTKLWKYPGKPPAVVSAWRYGPGRAITHSPAFFAASNTGCRSWVLVSKSKTSGLGE